MASLNGREYNDAYSSTLKELKNRLERVTDSDDRVQEFCEILKSWSEYGDDSMIEIVMRDLMNTTSLFPRADYKSHLLKFSLQQRNLKIVKLIEASEFKIHEVRFEYGYSALHYLAKLVYEVIDGKPHSKSKTSSIMQYLLENQRINHCDDHGYTYLHGACMVGNERAVTELLKHGANVNVNTYTCSPLSIAVRYRNENVVEMLLAHGADPNLKDKDESISLHALSRLCLCTCTNAYKFCDKRKPVDNIVKMLVDRGAEIEARDRDGNTPLQLAASRFDAQLAKALLKAGASLLNLNEDKIFNASFTSMEMKNYPLSLNIIEVMGVLRVAGYRVNFQTRHKMMRCIMRVRRNDIEHLIPEMTGSLPPTRAILEISHNLFIYKALGFYMNQEVTEQLRKFESIDPYYKEIFLPSSDEFNLWTEEVSKSKDIMVSDKVSLYELCQTNYSKGYSIIRSTNNNWLIPTMDAISCTRINMIVKRHIANIFLRRQLELYVGDLFTTDHCRLNLPHTVCRQVAEYTSDEDLFRLLEQTKDIYPSAEEDAFTNHVLNEMYSFWLVCFSLVSS